MSDFGIWFFIGMFATSLFHGYCHRGDISSDPNAHWLICITISYVTSVLGITICGLTSLISVICN